jgi:large subunit ribosomal protein L9
MKVILTEDVSSLGNLGSVVQVKNGYARNFLLPRALAVPANESNKKELEHRTRTLAAKRKKQIDEFEKIAKKIAKTKITLEKQVGEEDRIFGTVTSAEIADALTALNFSVSKKDIVVPEIKTTGKYTVDISLHPEVKAVLTIRVSAQG